MDEGFATQVLGGKLFPCNVGETIRELVMTSCDEAILITMQGMANGECNAAFSICHALHRNKGGLITTRLNELCDGFTYLAGNYFTP